MWTPEAVKELLLKSDKAVERAILALHERQTYEEQNIYGTKEINGIGFNKFDAPFLTDLAKKLLNGYSLTPKQIAAARKSLIKYKGQLSEIAIKKDMECQKMNQTHTLLQQDFVLEN